MTAAKQSPRYPYTFACDFIRSYVKDCNEAVGMPTPALSRAQASQAMHAFEAVFGLSHEEMAQKLADFALAEEEKERAK